MASLINSEIYYTKTQVNSRLADKANVASSFTINQRDEMLGAEQSVLNSGDVSVQMVSGLSDVLNSTK